jgi:molybdopterin synthase sulfur carrier subunit
MKVTIKTIFSMEQYVGGHATQSLNLPDDATLMAALEKLMGYYGPSLQEKMFDGDRLRKGVVLYVNGRHFLVLDQLQTILKDADEILIMPPVGGG